MIRVDLGSLERKLGMPSEQRSHFRTNGANGKASTVNACYWPCGCRALVVDGRSAPFAPCDIHGEIRE